MPGFLFRHRCLVPLLPLCLALADAPVLAPAQTPATPSLLKLSAPTATPDPLEVTDTNYVPPLAIKRLPVAYPELAHLNRAQGVVEIQFSVDENGDVTKVVVARSSGSLMLDAAVVRDYNLLHWKFQPATLYGKPVPSTKEQEFEFRLDPAEERALALKRLALPVGTPDAPYPKEGLRLKPRGSVTVGVHWTSRGLVNLIYLVKASGSNILDRAALRWAYENWHIDPTTINDKNKDDAFTKTMNFEPPP